MLNMMKSEDKLAASMIEIIKKFAPTDFAHLHCVKIQKEKCITLVISNADFYYAKCLSLMQMH